MKLKSLLIAATMAGGIALGATAANADVYSVSSGEYAGTFDLNYSGPLSALPFGTALDGSGGTGFYTGLTQIEFNPIFTLLVYGDSANNSYVIDATSFSSTKNLLTLGTVGGGTATISAAPEPGVWALMIAGVAMIGSALRFARKQNGALAVA